MGRGSLKIQAARTLLLLSGGSEMRECIKERRPNISPQMPFVLSTTTYYYCTLTRGLQG